MPANVTSFKQFVTQINAVISLFISKEHKVWSVRKANCEIEVTRFFFT